MYGTIKANKPKKDYPIRIVVSTVGTPSYRICDHLVQIILPMLNNNDMRLRNSRAFEKAKQWIVTADEIQVSFDVVNLYPSIPVKESITVMMQMLSQDIELKNRTKFDLNDIKKLIELCLDGYFIWENQIHTIAISGPIG